MKEGSNLINSEFFDRGLHNIHSETHYDFSPALDLIEEDTRYLLLVDLPGISRDDINVEYKNNLLTLRGEKKHLKLAEGSSLYKSERCLGRFYRTLSISGINEEKIDAVYKDGVLRVDLPKLPEKQTRKISINHLH
jgi:HSP20 family protein